MTNKNKLSVEETDELKNLERRLNELRKRQGEDSQEPAQRVQQDEYIRVMSLIPHPLNLSTGENGQGSIKRFTRFGEIKKILYKDLVNIVEAHPTWVEAGYFYILHAAFIRELGLDDIYSKILDKEKIEQILSANSEEAVDLYNSASPEQQKIIIELLISKVIENKDSVNLNVIDKLSRISGINIVEKAEFAKSIQSGNS